MKKFWILPVIALMALLTVASDYGTFTKAAPASRVTKSAAFDCLFVQFKAAVYAGPDTGVSMQGNLNLHVDDSGSVNGVLKQAKQADIQAVGQANGRAIHLIFDLGQARLIYGVGTLQNPIQMCKGAVGGPLVGPNERDSGSWQSVFMCTPVNVASPICTASLSSRGNPAFVMSPRACCK